MNGDAEMQTDMKKKKVPSPAFLSLLISYSNKTKDGMPCYKENKKRSFALKTLRGKKMKKTEELYCTGHKATLQSTVTVVQFFGYILAPIQNMFMKGIT